MQAWERETEAGSRLRCELTRVYGLSLSACRRVMPTYPGRSN